MALAQVVKTQTHNLWLFKYEVKNAQSISFWFDNWLGVGRLIDITRDVGNGTSEWIGKKRYLKWSKTQIGTWDLEAEGCSLRNMIRFMFCQRQTPWLVLIYRNGDMVMIISKKNSLLQRHGSICAQGRIMFHDINLFGSHRVFLNNHLRFGGNSRQAVYWYSYETLGNFLGLCLLGERKNSRNHLFFACPNTFTVWENVVGWLFGPSITPDWNDTIRRLISYPMNKLDSIPTRLLFQTVI